MIEVATWNVLHRVHADNWYPDAVQRWGHEPTRIAGITERVVGLPAQVIALQEVSGDQLAALRTALPGHTVHALRYPRIPRPRRVESVLADRAEYLVLVIDGPSREVAAEPFADDPGKGVLAAEFDGVLIIATHVTGDERRSAQLARLADLAVQAPARVAVLLGDFNIDRATVAAELGAGFEVSAPGAPTRPRDADEKKSQFIDLIATRGATVNAVAVDDANGLSDHNPVRATITR